MPASPSDRTLTRLAADCAREEGTYRPTGEVELRAIPTWLKSERFVTATLSPAQAIDLAIALLTAAQLAQNV